ncbi:D-2-hydroxyacid dehydrogenase [Hydrogenimonas sp.]
MKLALLDAKTLGNDIDLGVFEIFGEVAIYETTAPQDRIARCREADIVITNKVVIDREVIDACERLKLICVAATGMNNVDLDYAKAKGIEVRNVAGYSTQSVVQHTFAMLFYLMEKLPFYDEYVRSKAWAKSGIFTCVERPFRELEGKQWGIVGLGAIGKAVAKVAEAFGASVVYYSTSGENDDPTYPRMELETLLTTSHIVSIHAPLIERTKNLLDLPRLQMLQKGAILLNLGRGGIVNEAALAQVLKEEEIYAGLDVTEKEPLPEDSPLYDAMETGRLLITPHIAWTSVEARERLVAGIVKNIEAFLKRHTI